MLTTLFPLAFFFFALESDKDISNESDDEGSGSGFTSGPCSFLFFYENSVGCVMSSKSVSIMISSESVGRVNISKSVVRVRGIFSVGSFSGILKVG